MTINWHQYGFGAIVAVGVAVWIGVALTGCIHDTNDDGLFRPPPPVGPPQSETELIDRLKSAYQRRDYDALRRILHPQYAFVTFDATPGGITNWGRTDELRIHSRMFDPQNVQPPAPPVPQDLWLISVDISLTAQVAFQEAPAYYFDPVTNPTGLPRGDFTVTQADYAASVFFQTYGETQYRVDGTENFVVVNDLSKAAGDDGKFLLYRWHDLGSTALSAVEPKTWTSVKMLYK